MLPSGKTLSPRPSTPKFLSPTETVARNVRSVQKWFYNVMIVLSVANAKLKVTEPNHVTVVTMLVQVTSARGKKNRCRPQQLTQIS